MQCNLMFNIYDYKTYWIKQSKRNNRKGKATETRITGRNKVKRKQHPMKTTATKEKQARTDQNKHTVYQPNQEGNCK